MFFLLSLQNYFKSVIDILLKTNGIYKLNELLKCLEQDWTKDLEQSLFFEFLNSWIF